MHRPRSGSSYSIAIPYSPLPAADGAAGGETISGCPGRRKRDVLGVRVGEELGLDRARREVVVVLNNDRVCAVREDGAVQSDLDHGGMDIERGRGWKVSTLRARRLCNIRGSVEAYVATAEVFDLEPCRSASRSALTGVLMCALACRMQYSIYACPTVRSRSV
jgi:hypothetical protein